MKTFVSVSLILFSLLNCHSLKKSQKEKVWGIVVERTVPDIYFDSLKNQMIISRYIPYFTKIYYYKNQVLLQSSYPYRKVNLGVLNEDEKQLYIDSLSEENRYFTFIYSNQATTGWLCDSNNVKNGRMAKKDSLLESQWIVASQTYDILKSSDHTLVSSNTSKDGTITEQYRLKDKVDTSMTGSLMLVFSNKEFGPFEYSLAKDIEQQKKMKVIKMITVNDARYVPPTNTFIGRMELSYELKKIAITNENEIITMFKFAEAALQ